MSIRPGAPALAELAVPVPRVAPDIALPALEAMFRADADLRAVVTWSHEQWQAVSRSWVDDVMAGRFGYGRALAARQPLAAFLPLPTLVVAPDSSLDAAAEAILALAGRRADDILIAGDVPAVVPVASVFAALAQAYGRAAMTDALTSVANRLALNTHLAEVDPAGTDLALLYIDLDGFKSVNDTYGHGAGDDLLVTSAARICESVRPADLVARVGGDEFVVVLTGVTPEVAETVGRRVLEAVALPAETTAGHVVSVSASVGLAFRPAGLDGEWDETAVDSLLRRADHAMYDAKRRGRNRLEQRDEAPSGDRVPMALRLRNAVRSGGLTLHYQPKVSLTDLRVVEYEALCRWTDPELGVVAPDVFIPAAERAGVIEELDRWVLRQACADLRRWLDEGRQVAVAVNVSPAHVTAEGFADAVTAVVEEFRIPRHRLRLEITETAAVRDMVRTAAHLTQLRKHGVLLSLDDFGTGYSSLTLLRQLPVHGVKIDKSFVDRVGEDATDTALVRMIVAGAHELGLTVIAEGVEHEHQLDVLRTLGCDFGQGYFFGRPEPLRV